MGPSRSGTDQQYSTDGAACRIGSCEAGRDGVRADHASVLRMQGEGYARREGRPEAGRYHRDVVARDNEDPGGDRGVRASAVRTRIEY